MFFIPVVCLFQCDILVFIFCYFDLINLFRVSVSQNFNQTKSGIQPLHLTIEKAILSFWSNPIGTVLVAALIKDKKSFSY